jgi:hypothetical protein
LRADIGNFTVGVVVLAEESKGCADDRRLKYPWVNMLPSMASCISRNRDEAGVVKLAVGCNAGSEKRGVLGAEAGVL